MFYAISEGGQVALGGFYFLVLIALVAGLIYFLEKKYGNKIRQRKRDREIRTAMLLGMRDGEAQERIARELQQEYFGPEFK